ncbi:MAG TPA: hypothetical protein VK761_04640 [Solirubrobacteraceae bacterium]|jgi:hypothetical protein|nr:hypothetical protein [Solirubrobacteraceae bacterium]
MAKILVTSDDTQQGAPAVLLEESVSAVHLSTDHAAMQLIERLDWAVKDAEELERISRIEA